MNLNNKVVVITGASSGVGKASAIEFAKKKCHLVLVARRLDKLIELKNSLQHLNNQIFIVKADIGLSKEVQQVFIKTEKQFGKVDVLINNAGRELKSKLLDITESEWDAVHQTNVKGVFLCTQAAVGIMKKNKTPGHVITVSSIAGLYGAPGYSGYCSSKHAVTGFKRSLRLELFKDKIKVSVVFPARINTEFFSKYKNRPSQRQMLSSKDIAQYLVSIAERNILKIYYFKFRNIFKRINNLIA